MRVQLGAVRHGWDERALKERDQEELIAVVERQSVVSASSR